MSFVTGTGRLSEVTERLVTMAVAGVTRSNEARGWLVIKFEIRD
jgi:hypothetical protein